MIQSETASTAQAYDGHDPSLDEGSRTEYPLLPVVSAWLIKIQRAMKFKKDRFQDDADDALKFYECGKKLHELMWDGTRIAGKNLPGEDDEETPAPKFRVVVGKTAELVQRFGPAIYHNNPTIAVEPKTAEIPDDHYLALIPPQMMQQAQMVAQQSGQPFNPKSLIPPDPDKAQADVVADLMEYTLNYMQRENDKKTHSRRFAEETLIKGMSCLWTEYIEPYPDGPKMIVSTFDSVNNFVFDPDAEQREKALWCARRKIRPVWEVAEEWGIDLEYMKKRKGVAESINAQAENRSSPDYNDDKNRGRTNDLVEYWEIYSKMGMGENLSGVGRNIDGLKDYLRSFGDNVYLVVCEKIPFFLNLHHDLVMEGMTEPDEENTKPYDDAFMRVQWPIPFWEFGEWPMTTMAFRESPDNPWPMPYIKPALGHLKFINWCMSFLVNKVRTACCTVVSCMKSLDEELKQRILSGKDFRLLEVESNMVPDGDLSKAVHFHTMPEFHQDIYKVLEAESEAFDKATGLSALMYGMPGGMRSSAEAQQKAHNANAPLDDMASRMEDALSLVARKEAMALRWISTGKDVAPIIGKQNAQLWDQYVATKDFESISREYHYRIEAGSTRKPNKDTQSANITAAMQAWAPMIQWALAHGQIDGINEMMRRWFEANDFDLKNDFLQPPPPPPPNPEMLKIQAEIEGKKQESAIKQQESQQRLQAESMKAMLQQRTAQMKMQTEREKAAQDIALRRAEGQQDLQLRAVEGQQDMALARAEGGLKMQQLHQQGQMNQVQAVHDMRLKAIQARQQAAQPKPNGSTA